MEKWICASNKKNFWSEIQLEVWETNLCIKLKKKLTSNGSRSTSHEGQVALIGDWAGMAPKTWCGGRSAPVHWTWLVIWMKREGITVLGEEQMGSWGRTQEEQRDTEEHHLCNAAIAHQREADATSHWCLLGRHAPSTSAGYSSRCVLAGRCRLTPQLLTRGSGSRGWGEGKEEKGVREEGG